MLEGRGDETYVVVHTTLNVTGRPAQFGRGVMAEVGGKLIGIFASNLADMLSADAAQPADGGAAEGADGGGGAAEPAQPADGGAAGEQEGDLDQSIESLNLSLRSYNSLRREGIHTVTDLAARTREQLLAIDHIGPASVEEIRQKLADRGLTLSESPVSGNGVAGAAASLARVRHVRDPCGQRAFGQRGASTRPRGPGEPRGASQRRQVVGRRRDRPAQRGRRTGAQARDPGRGRARRRSRDRAADPGQAQKGARLTRTCPASHQPPTPAKQGG